MSVVKVIRRIKRNCLMNVQRLQYYRAKVAKSDCYSLFRLKILQFCDKKEVFVLTYFRMNHFVRMNQVAYF